jgi:4-oxalocrotonate tautomerase
MPLVHIDILERSARERRALAASVTAAIVDTLNVPPESVHVVIHEMSRTHYAVAGVLHAESGKKGKPARRQKK